MPRFAEKRFLAFLAALILAAPVSAAEPPALSVRSPDGALAVLFELKSNPAPYLPGIRAYYRVTDKGKTLLKDSPLGLDFLGAPPLGTGNLTTRPGRMISAPSARSATISISSRFPCASAEPAGVASTWSSAPMTTRWRSVTNCPSRTV